MKMAWTSNCCVNERWSKIVLSFVVIILMCYLSLGGFTYFNFTRVTVLTSRSHVYSSTLLVDTSNSTRSRNQDKVKGTLTSIQSRNQDKIKGTLTSTQSRNQGQVKGTLTSTKLRNQGKIKSTLTATHTRKKDKIKGTLNSTQTIKPVKSKASKYVRNGKEVVYVNGIRIEYNERQLQWVIGNISERMYRKERNDTCIQRYPGAVIVGVSKCGTREISDFMRMHPYIVPKSHNRHYKIPPKLFRNLTKSHDGIKNSMPCTYQDQIGTFKEDFAFMDPDMPRALYMTNPHMKIMAMVREPVARVISQKSFRYSKTSHGSHSNLNPDFRHHVFVKNSIAVRSNSKFVKLSTYSDCLKRYMEYFPMSQILIIQTEEFNKDPVTVLNRVQEFLGVKKFDFHNHFLVNPESGFHCVKTEEESAEQSMVCYNKNRGRYIEPGLTDAEMQSLRDYFKPFNEELFQLLGQRFDEWEYV